MLPSSPYCMDKAQSGGKNDEAHEVSLPRAPLIGIGISNLKKVQKPLVFTKLDITSKMSASIDERQRFVDSVRLYSPQKVECDDLNIGSDRLHLHEMNKVLLLCGGARGVRFSNDDFMFLKSTTSSAASFFRVMEEIYQSIPPARRRKHDSDVDEDMKVRSYYESAEKYLATIRDLQAFVVRKQAEISNDIVLTFERDDSSKGSRLPKWLAILVEKYNSHGAALCGPLSRGKLAAFIGCCIVGSVRCSEEEKLSLAEVIEASNDSLVQVTGTLDSLVGALKADTTHDIDQACGGRTEAKAFGRSTAYWARRIFAFISKMSELSSVPLDEKSVLVFDTFSTSLS